MVVAVVVKTIVILLDLEDLVAEVGAAAVPDQTQKEMLLNQVQIHHMVPLTMEMLVVVLLVFQLLIVLVAVAVLEEQVKILQVLAKLDVVEMEEHLLLHMDLPNQ